MKTKAIIFDIDGTIMPQGSPNDPTLMPSERFKLAIQNLKQEYYIAFASGRAQRHVQHIIEFLEFEDENIISAGTEIINAKTGKITWSQGFSAPARAHMLKVLENCEYRIATPQQKSIMHDFDSTELENELNYDTTALYIMGVPPKEAQQLVEKLTDSELTIVNMHHYKNYELRDIHITSHKASKEHAVNELLRRQGITKENTIVVGDGSNDLLLFKAGGTKVAMGNAAPELKAEADIIIGDVKDDGLAEYLESLITEEI